MGRERSQWVGLKTKRPTSIRTLLLPPHPPPTPCPQQLPSCCHLAPMPCKGAYAICGFFRPKLQKAAWTPQTSDFGFGARDESRRKKLDLRTGESLTQIRHSHTKLWPKHCVSDHTLSAKRAKTPIGPVKRRN